MGNIWSKGGGTSDWVENIPNAIPIGMNAFNDGVGGAILNVDDLLPTDCSYRESRICA